MITTSADGGESGADRSGAPFRWSPGPIGGLSDGPSVTPRRSRPARGYRVVEGHRLEELRVDASTASCAV
jgi:hypothetical protein